MSDEMPDPGRRALVIWYCDDTNTVEVDSSAFTWLELPELLKTAMDYAEMQLPQFDYEESETTDE